MAELYPEKTPTTNSTEIAARLKILEERYANLSRREQIAEQNLITFEKDFRSDIRAIQQRMVDTRKHIADVREKLETMEGQVAKAADKHDLRVLEAYLNMIQPLQFMTRAEAKKLLEK